MRRVLLTLLVLLAATGGCTEAIRETFPGDGEAERATVDRLVVRNHDDRPHTVTVRVPADGTALNRTLSVGPAPERGELVTARTEPVELVSLEPAGREAVATAPGNRSARVPLERFDRPGCTVLAVDIAANGTLSVGPGCETGSPSATTGSAAA